MSSLQTAAITIFGGYIYTEEPGNIGWQRAIWHGSIAWTKNDNSNEANRLYGIDTISNKRIILFKSANLMIYPINTIIWN